MSRNKQYSDFDAIARVTRLEAPWLHAPALEAIFAILKAGGFEARVVGGAVRNALLGRPVSDTDIATTSPPEDTMRLAAAAGLGVYPTGIGHGTVTVVAHGTSFEVTSLRQDVETDGRHAVVAFTDDWSADAKRRDFTINALYAASDGTIFDYTEGRKDLAAGRVRFIGDASARIREDYLRILRFFRFSADYGCGDADATGLAACTELKSGMTRLSGERVGAEMMKLLVSPRAAEICEVMNQRGILEIVLGKHGHPERLLKLQTIQNDMAIAAEAIPRLAALALDTPGDTAEISRKLRLSNEANAILMATATPHPALNPNAPERDAKALLYRLGPTAFQRAVQHAWAASNAPATDPAWHLRYRLAERWSPPRMPFTGVDVLALNVEPGPIVGKVLSAFELWWAEQNFPSDPALQKRKLADLVRNG